MTTTICTDAQAERDLPELLTVRQTAQLANVSEKTVYRMIADEQLKAVRIRNTWRVNRDSLREQFGL